MIASFHHKGLERLWHLNDGSKLPAIDVKKIRRILILLDKAKIVGDMRFPGSGLHPLKGDLKDYWAVTVRANWRIIFFFENGNAHVIDFLDYH